MFSIASSSSGNAICIGTDDYHILIDAGISCKKIIEGLSHYDLTLDDINDILVTHEHSDHIKGLGVLTRKSPCNIYATRGTWQGIMDCKSLGDIDWSLYHEVRCDVSFEVGPFTVNPFHISHDANEPTAYVISYGNKKVAVATDIGVYDEYIVDKLTGLDAILLEANYDYNMLQVGSYPTELKRRIHSDIGHLSNEMSGRLLSDIACDELRYVLLGHMSKENNYPELAYETVRCELALSDVKYMPDDFVIMCAPRESVSERIIV